eukprot:591952-Alexandrium_andersonii.AAC.1
MARRKLQEAAWVVSGCKGCGEWGPWGVGALHHYHSLGTFPSSSSATATGCGKQCESTIIITITAWGRFPHHRHTLAG